MCFSCKWSYRPCKNMWFNKGWVSSFCGITVLLKLFLCNSIITMIDCISCSCPSHHFFSVHPENNYHFPLNPISNTLGLPWNKTPVSYPWHPLALFTLFLSFCLCDWMPNVCSPTKPSEPDLPTRLPPCALLLFPFLSEMNSSGGLLCHCSLIEALDAVFICVFSRTHPASLPWQAFVFWRPTHCGALTGSAEQRSSGEPRPLFLSLFQCSFKALVLKSCTSTDIILKRETCHIFSSAHVHGFAPYVKQAVRDFQHHRSRLYQQVFIQWFYPGLMLLLTRIQAGACAVKCTYRSMLCVLHWQVKPRYLMYLGEMWNAIWIPFSSDFKTPLQVSVQNSQHVCVDTEGI